MSGQQESINKVATGTGNVNHHNKRPVVLIYPTVSPETVVVPIISCIFGFPLLALLVICCLRRRAKLAREQARRRNCDSDHGTFSIVRFSPIHYLESGGDILSLKRYGGWKSSTVAEGYIEESIEDKKRIASMVQNIPTDPQPQPSTSSEPDENEDQGPLTWSIRANVNTSTLDNNTLNFENRTINIIPSGVSGLSFNMTCNNCTI